jgi:hypothetical protein
MLLMYDMFTWACSSVVAKPLRYKAAVRVLRPNEMNEFFQFT